MDAFARIVRHEAPAHIVWEDDSVVAFLDSHPHTAGHTLVIPTMAVDRWTDLDHATAARVFLAAQRVGAALVQVYEARRAGLVIAGYHIPHAHLHVFPTNGLEDFDFTYLPPEADDVDLAREAVRIRAALNGRVV
ncbi:HIT family protein [Gryllotalpicola reticulitermitis]|uniref:HIT family protein n=1 Tax=Gryllotalpicola reticulitermitis TaxID=1184153 RepID=A0ABV8Q6A6_9MICO